MRDFCFDAEADLPVICCRYPGRASSAPLMDLFITLLSMGRSGLLSLMTQRENLFAHAKTELAALAAKHGERLLNTSNQISMSMSLARLGPNKATELGSKLFSRCCSGSRTVSCQSTQTVAGIAFSGFGAHIDAYPTPYLTVCTILGVDFVGNSAGHLGIFTFLTNFTDSMCHWNHRK